MKYLASLYAFIAIIGALLMVLVVIGYVAGARINTTKSIPVGLYWTTNDLIKKGDYVFFCPPESSIFALARKRNYISYGVCPGGYGYMMKKILAAGGDQIEITEDGVWVNDHLLMLSKVLNKDRAGRPMPHYKLNKYTLTRTEVLLMSDVSSTSFDARYFGPINLSQIKNNIRPILIW